MRWFRFFLVAMLLVISGCSGEKKHICETCKMPIDLNSPYTSTIKNHYFDEVGCMVLFNAKESLSKDDMYVNTKDTHRKIKAIDAYYKIDEKTPMSYGFAAYEQKDDSMIDFNEMYTKMLRGEHMANPKIKKQLLGDKH